MFSFKEIVDEFPVGDSVGKIPFSFLVFSNTNVNCFPSDRFLCRCIQHIALLHKNVHEFNVVPQTHKSLAHRAFSASLYRNVECPTSCSNILCVKGRVKPKGTQMTVGSNSFRRVKQLGVMLHLHGRILVPFRCPYFLCTSENVSKSCCFNETNPLYGRHTNISLIRAQLLKRWITPTTG